MMWIRPARWSASSFQGRLGETHEALLARRGIEAIDELLVENAFDGFGATGCSSCLAAVRVVPRMTVGDATDIVAMWGTHLEAASGVPNVAPWWTSIVMTVEEAARTRPR